MRLDTETEVTQNLRSQPVAQTNVFEPDHVPLRRAAANAHQPISPRVSPYIAMLPAWESTTFGQIGRPQPLCRRATTLAVPWGLLGFRSFNERPASVPGNPPSDAIHRC